MPFITQGKTNWKFLLIVIILAIIVGGGILSYCQRFRQEVKTPEGIVFSEKSNEPTNIEDAKQMVSNIDWQFSISGEENGKPVTYLLSGPYFYKQMSEEFSGDTIIFWVTKNVSSDAGQTWTTFDEGIPILSFIDNKNANRCDITSHEGQESMVISVSGSGIGKYYKTINDQKIFSFYNSPEGYVYIWCNKLNTLQIFAQHSDINFAEMVVDKYFETFVID